jgi:hypothetical protein
MNRYDVVILIERARRGRSEPVEAILVDMDASLGTRVSGLVARHHVNPLAGDQPILEIGPGPQIGIRAPKIR